MSVTIEPSSELLFVCPGRRVELNCSVEPLQSVIQWSIWCKCSSDSSGTCRETCPCPMMSVVNTENEQHNGTLCASDEHNNSITYENSFSVVTDQNMLVPFSAVSIAVPMDFQQQRLCLECDSEMFRVDLQVPGKNCNNAI